MPTCLRTPHASATRSSIVNQQLAPFTLNRSILILPFISIYLLLTGNLGLCEDSPANPGLDLGALASLATNLGNNPQIMGVFSSLLNQNTPKLTDPQELATNSIATGEGIQQNHNNQPAVVGDPLRRSPRAQQPAEAKRQADVTPLAASSPGLNLGGLLAAFTSGSKPQVSPPAASKSNLPLGIQTSPVASLNGAPNSVVASSSSQTTSGPNSAQTVINQVLTAYASGQIPNELIQLALSGKVPSNIMELALSGQIPAPIIQMVISGQVPMSTINAFLGTQSSGGDSHSSASRSSDSPEPSSSSSSSTSLSTTTPFKASTSNQPTGSSNFGLGSTTRSIFEALFNRQKNSTGAGGSTSFTVPTLLGPLPIQIPSFPNVRRLGQMVGGTITNVASMIPF